MDLFTCDACGGTFPKLWSDADAMRESVELFGDVPREDLAQVCDDCFQRIVLATFN